MKWINLKTNKCPSCNTSFGYGAFDKPGYVRCYKCGFAIRESRFQEIVNSQVTRQLEDKWNEEYQKPHEQDTEV